MTQALDLSALRNLKSMIGGDPDDLAELVNDFVTALPEQVQQMQSAAAGGDLAALRIAAHSCKSNARDLGASHLSDLCAGLETQSAAGDGAGLARKLAEISDAAAAALSQFAQLDLSDV